MTKIIIIGGGPAGTAAALKAAEAGWETILVEKDKLGGTCLQRGCIPTKCLLEEAHVLDLARKRFGDIEVDENSIFQRKDALVDELTQTLIRQIETKKIRVVYGEARFSDANHLTVGADTISADIILIATGSRNRIFDFPGGAQLWTSDEALFSPLIANRRVLLVGGGVIGVELAAYYKAMGHDVTIFEKESRILPNVPKDLVASITADFKKDGIRILTSVEISAIIQNAAYEVAYNGLNEEFDIVVLCAGRVAATETLRLDMAGITHDRGLIVVDGDYRTNVPHIYAVGDAACKVQLAHVASRQANDVMDQLIAGKACRPFLIPSAIYTPVQAAWLGKSEEQLKADGIRYRSFRQPLGALAKSKIKGDGRRYISVHLDEADRLLGVAMYLSDASEFLPFFTFLMEHDIPFTQAADIVYPHPTLSEAIGELAANIRLKSAGPR